MGSALQRQIVRRPTLRQRWIFLALFTLWTVSVQFFRPAPFAISAWLKSSALVIGMIVAIELVPRWLPSIPILRSTALNLEWSLKRLYLTFFGAFAVVWAMMVSLKVLLNASMVPWTWPISIVRPRLPPRAASFLSAKMSGIGFGSGTRIQLVYQIQPIDVVIAAIAVGVFLWFISDIEHRSVTEIFGGGLLLLLLTNLVQGYQNGYLFPILGNGKDQYYTTASHISSTLSFLGRYDKIQQSLSLHASTHPPGVPLFYYFIGQLAGLLGIAIAIAVLTMLGVYFVYGLVDHFYGQKAALFSAVVFAVLPSIQIYGIAAIDGVICMLFAGSLYFYVKFADHKGNQHVMASLSALFLFGAMSLTYLGVFLIGVMVLDQWRRNGISLRSFGTIAAVVLPVAILLSAIFGITGFDYIAGFYGAFSNKSATSGAVLFLLKDPVNYVLTRAECIGEPILFFTPVPVALAYRSLRDSSGESFFGFDFDAGTWLLVYAIVGYLGLLFVGAYNTAETARGAMYLFPFLTLGVGSAVSRLKLGTTALKLTATLVFAQALVMQLFGFYFW